MRVLTWNMGHRGPGLRRGNPQDQWSLVAGLVPDVILAQEAPAPDLVDFSGYEVAFAPVSARHVGYVVAVRQTAGSLEATPVNTDRDDLAVWGVLQGIARVLLVSTNVSGRRNPNHALDRALKLADEEPLLIGGDFSAGPSVGANNPCDYAPTVGLRELSTSVPETNTIRNPRQTGQHQVDHVFGRGFTPSAPMEVIPVADDGGSAWSYHNVVIVELDAPS